MTIEELEKKYPSFSYFDSFDGWVFQTDNFKVTFELKENTTIQDLINDDKFIYWLNESFKNAIKFQKEAVK